jgi:choice-of-anchor C domain-containing protein
MISKCLIAALCLSTPLMANANLLSNGSFEDGDYTGIPGGNSWTAVPSGGTAITGWIATPSGCDWHQELSVGGEFGPAFAGQRMVDLTLGSDTGGIMQSFATVPGEVYHLSFAVAAPAGASTVDVSVAGLTEQYSVPGTDRYAMTWQTKSLDFTASSTITTLAFAGTTANYWGAVIDDVAVTTASVPDSASSLALLGISFGFISAFRRRLS